MGYVTPADVAVSDTRAGHIARGSKEPGTDYATAYGTDLRAPEDGVIIAVDPNNGGAEGRRISFLLNNGEVIDWIHLSKIMMNVGQKIAKGTKGIALSGASGFGKDWHYGPHVHVTRRAKRGLPYSQTLDFQAVAETSGGNPGGSPANVAAGQRTTGGNGARRRTQPTSKSPEAGDMLKPATVGNFTGWIRGESVDGIDIWFKGISGDWFWAGGFTQGANTAGLADLNPTTPPPASGTTRTTGANGARRRGTPSTRAAETGEMLAPGVVGNFDAWARGESVEGNDIWFRGISGSWFWSGGFVGGASTAGLPEVPTPGGGTTPPVTPPEAAAPRTPTYGGAARGWTLPWALSRTDAVTCIFLHHQGGTGDDEGYFKTKNERSSWPTFQVKATGEVVEFAEPTTQRPSSTQNNNGNSLSIETQNSSGSPAWGISDASHESIAQIVAWASKKYGFPIDAAHIRKHSEVYATACPGPSMDVARIIKRALELNSTKPESETVQVERSWLQGVLDKLKSVLGGSK